MSNPISYNGVEIVPAPFTSFTKTYINNEANRHIGTTYTIRLNGTLVHNKGVFNDTLDGREGFCALTYKIHKLKELFADDKKEFIWFANASTYIRCYPTVESIDINEGINIQTTTYTITLNAPEILWTNGTSNEDATADLSACDVEAEDFFTDESGDNLFLTSASESWNIEQMNEGISESKPYTYRITHSMRATGRDVYRASGVEKLGWESAKQWCEDRKGYDATKINNFLIYTLSGYTNYDHIITTSVDDTAGSYTLTETWLLADSTITAMESFTVSCSRESGKYNVAINGTIRGLITESAYGVPASTTAYDKALARWLVVQPLLYTRCNTIFSADTTINSNYILNSSAVNTSVAHNEIGGIISYTYNYDTTPSHLVSGSLSEHIAINNDWGGSAYAAIAVLGRPNGPILQDLNTCTEKSTTVNIQIVMPAYGGIASNNLVGIINSSPRSTITTEVVEPMETSLEAAYTQVFRTNDTENWDHYTGNYTRSIRWVFQGGDDEDLDPSTLSFDGGTI